jgi:hypothetical protein
MRGLQLLLFSSFILITSSCNQFKQDDLPLKNDVKQIIFFSNESDYTGEASYYDALIELKNRFPNEFKNMLVLSSTEAKPYYKAYHVEACPALLVINNNEVAVKIFGNVSKEEIIQPVTDVLTLKPE